MKSFITLALLSLATFSHAAPQIRDDPVTVTVTVTADIDTVSNSEPTTTTTTTSSTTTSTTTTATGSGTLSNGTSNGTANATPSPEPTTTVIIMLGTTSTVTTTTRAVVTLSDGVLPPNGTMTISNSNPSSTPTSTPTSPTTPDLPLLEYQLPVRMPNGVIALGASLQMSVSSTTPDIPIPVTAQIGTDAYLLFPFNSTHSGKQCRFHFAFSAADGSNDEGALEIYVLASAFDESLTYNNRPVSAELPVARFLPMDEFGMKYQISPGDEYSDYLLYTDFKEDFECPTEPTGWEVRGVAAEESPAVSSANWSWNHGLIVEVLGDRRVFPWDEGKNWKV